MPKTLLPYRAFTANMIKGKATLPASADLVINGNNVDCKNITTTLIRNQLGGTSNNVGALCKLGSINSWSGYSPLVHSISNQAIASAAPSANFKMGDIMAYNHNAAAPGWNQNGLANASADVWADAGGTATFPADVHVGELNLKDLGITGIVLAIYYGTNIVAWAGQDIDSISYDTSLYAQLANASIERTYTGKLWFVNSIVDFDETQIVARVPNTADYSVNLKIKQLDEWHYQDTGTTTAPSPWSKTASAGMNWSTGYFSIGTLICSSKSYTNVKVQATLYDCSYNIIGQGYAYNDIYYAGDDLTGSVYLGMSSIPANGYHVIVTFLYTT